MSHNLYQPLSEVVEILHYKWVFHKLVRAVGLVSAMVADNYLPFYYSPIYHSDSSLYGFPIIYFYSSMNLEIIMLFFLCLISNSKFQVPSSKQAPIIKLQIPNKNLRLDLLFWNLEFVWNLIIGTWNLNQRNYLYIFSFSLNREIIL